MGELNIDDMKKIANEKQIENFYTGNISCENVKVYLTCGIQKPLKVQKGLEYKLNFNYRIEGINRTISGIGKLETPRKLTKRDLQKIFLRINISIAGLVNINRGKTTPFVMDNYELSIRNTKVKVFLKTK